MVGIEILLSCRYISAGIKEESVSYRVVCIGGGMDKDYFPIYLKSGDISLKVTKMHRFVNI